MRARFTVDDQLELMTEPLLQPALPHFGLSDQARISMFCDGKGQEQVHAGTVSCSFAVFGGACAHYIELCCTVRVRVCVCVTPFSRGALTLFSCSRKPLRSGLVWKPTHTHTLSLSQKHTPAFSFRVATDLPNSHHRSRVCLVCLEVERLLLSL